MEDVKDVEEVEDMEDAGRTGRAGVEEPARRAIQRFSGQRDRSEEKLQAAGN